MKKFLTFIFILGAFNYSIYSEESINATELSSVGGVQEDTVKQDKKDSTVQHGDEFGNTGVNQIEEEIDSPDYDNPLGTIQDEPQQKKFLQRMNESIASGVNAYIVSPVKNFNNRVKDVVKEKIVNPINTEMKEMYGYVKTDLYNFYEDMRTYALVAVLLTGVPFAVSSYYFGVFNTIGAVQAAAILASHHLHELAISAGVFGFFGVDNLMFRGAFTRALARGTWESMKSFYNTFGTTYRNNLEAVYLDDLEALRSER